MDPAYLWRFFVVGYVVTIALETPVLLVGLSARHSLAWRLFCGVWLTACTYPIVVLVLPLLLEPHWLYLLVAETFAPAAECALFWAACGTRADWATRGMVRDFAAVTGANLLSFGVGEAVQALGWRLA